MPAASAASVAALPPGWAPHWVAPNLYLRKGGQTVGFWPLMYASPVKGHRVERGLGPARDPRFTGLKPDATGLLLRVAKTKGLEYRAQIVRGRCPSLSARASRLPVRLEDRCQVRAPLQAIAETYHTLRQASWANAKHRQQWGNTRLPKPWRSAARADQYRCGAGHLDTVMDRQAADREPGAADLRRSSTTARHAAGFMAKIPRLARPSIGCCHPVRGSPRSGIKGRCPGDVPAFYQFGLRCLILTALRTGEVRFATIDEIDRDALVHAIRAERTKIRTALRVPLSSEARWRWRSSIALLLVADERANRSATWQCSKSRVDWRLG